LELKTLLLSAVVKFVCR